MGNEKMNIDVDELAQEIRRVDGQHKLGAGQLAEALMPFLARSKWQDISTAPQDGSVVLGVTVEAQRPAVRITWFDADVGKWMSTGKLEKFVLQPHRWWPTHWVPLPQPPSSQENTNG